MKAHDGILAVRHLTPSIGVKATLARPIGEIPSAVFRDLLDRHHLVVICDRRLSACNQIDLLRGLGTVAKERGGESSVVTNNRADGRPLNELDWHADFSFTPFPLTEISLYGVEVTGSVSSTRFVGAARAFSALGRDLRECLERLTAVDVANANGTYVRGKDFEAVWEQVTAGSFEGILFRHPPVRHHPRSGMPLLCVSAMHTMGFHGLGFHEGRKLLAEVFAVLYDPAFTYTHQWHQGDLVVWDNIALQHARGVVPNSGTAGGIRTHRRVVNSDKFDELLDYVPALRAPATTSETGFM